LATHAQGPDFEQALRELERLVEQLERGDLPLEQAITTFERGIELTRNCQKSLRAAQQKVEILMRRNGGLVTENFVEPADDDGPDAGE
jgi:exodeoxyribonuclease VII small subunit